MIDSATVRMSGEPVARIGGAAASEKREGRSLSWFSSRRAESCVNINICLCVEGGTEVEGRIT